MKSLKIAGALGSALVIGLFGAQSVHAQYPERQINMVVPFGAGGSTDIVGRIAAQALSQHLKQPVIVDNRGGAGGTVGTQAAAGMAPDGYSITVATTSTHVVGPLTNAAVKYDPVKDFQHIGMIAETPYVMVVSPKFKVNNVQDVIDYAKKNPGKLNFGSAGQGSTTHLAGLMFLQATGTEMEHIPYNSNAEATTAVMGDEVQVLFGSMPAVLAQIKAGSIKALAVGTTNRSPELPDVPTMQQAGVAGYRASLWLGLAAPAKTPEAVIKRLNEALNASLDDPEVVKQLAANGAEAAKMSPAEFRKLIADELEVYGKIVAGMKK
ncbi:MAG: tripartite tricarboxylate transporter substrate binding protein [Zoogloeaceae bacterium]|nr:tripartite tricarboxylate transporter substrate binding protein [Zoogloeaceae bacterium]